MAEDTEADVTESTKSGRGPAPPRLSITIPPGLRKNIRLASALADMEPNEWARVVLITAARRTVEKRFPEKV